MERADRINFLKDLQSGKASVDDLAANEIVVKFGSKPVEVCIDGVPAENGQVSNKIYERLKKDQNIVYELLYNGEIVKVDSLSKLTTEQLYFIKYGDEKGY